MRVVRDQLLVRAVPRGDRRLDEIHELRTLRAACKVKVEPAVRGPDARGARVRPGPQDGLLKEEERALVAHVLPDLRAGDPRGRVRGGSGAVDALVRLHGEIDDASLLQSGPPQDLGLHSQLHFYAPRVRLRPDEARVDQPNGAVAAAGRRRPLADALDAAEAEGEELLRLGRGAGPVLRRLEVALAGRAPEDRELKCLMVDAVFGGEAERE